MKDADVTPVVQAERQHAEILASQILPSWTRDAVAQERPVVVLDAGPPGSGKSTLVDLVHAVLDQRGGAVTQPGTDGGGRSSGRCDSRVDHTPQNQADDVHAVIEALGAGPGEMFASSGGAITASRSWRSIPLT